MSPYPYARVNPSSSLFWARHRLQQTIQIQVLFQQVGQQLELLFAEGGVVFGLLRGRAATGQESRDERKSSLSSTPCR